MRQGWLNRMLDAVADRGREMLKLQPNGETPNIVQLCKALLQGVGEASGVALSREILRAYQGLDGQGRIEFFEMLNGQFGPDAIEIEAAAEAFKRSGSDEDFLHLYQAVEPPRQELFRRLNMAPSGTNQLVAMRGDLLGLVKAYPHFKAIDADLKHLLSSWFNRGFLRLERIDWRSPAHILEKLINYESVHAIRGWDDLHRRMLDDRRCFAFFHPAMPDEPLIFVEVALVQGMSRGVQQLLDTSAPLLDPSKADTAMFYSINNTQTGLRGISFGNFLIKQVLTELRAELPAIKCFATISPMPRFVHLVQAAAHDGHVGLQRTDIERLLEEYQDSLCQAAGLDSPFDALLALLQQDPASHREILAAPLEQLALAYLLLPGVGSGVVDPVASFHLSNGARLEAINPFADLSEDRMRSSFGVMANYLYDPDQVEANHERFVSEGEVAMSKAISRLHKRVLASRLRTETSSR